MFASNTTQVSEDVNYIESVFQSYLYTGNNTYPRQLINGIDLAGKGGLIWSKVRNISGGHFLVDTATAPSGNYFLQSNSTNALTNSTTYSYNNNGYTFQSTNENYGYDEYTFVSWTFRKQPKFFDVVTYTGNSVSGRQIAHNLGSAPGCMIIKRLDDITNWAVYHRSIGATNYLMINSTAASAGPFSGLWNNTDPSSTTFTLGNDGDVNANGSPYVAYLFAHNAGGFGLTGTDNVISCGSFTTDGSGNFSVNLGWEPQWVLFKATDSPLAWNLYDNMRGMPAWSGYSSSQRLQPQSSGAEGTQSSPNGIGVTSTGFSGNPAANNINFIYIAIRRGPMKTPTSGTQVYNAIARTGTGAAATVTGVGFAPDLIVGATRVAGYGKGFYDKLRGYLPWISSTATTSEQTNGTDGLLSFDMDGFHVGADSIAGFLNDATSKITYFFRRAPGFFDEVCYTGTGSATTFNHNLGVAPELMIIKDRTVGEDWTIYSQTLATNQALKFTTAAREQLANYWNTTRPTSSVFSVGDYAGVNSSGDKYVAYLFASCPGVSKVGSYTGNGSSQTINCGFSAGARFVLIKRTDAAGNWAVWDTARGIGAAGDPHLTLNLTNAEVSGYDDIDPDSSGFIVNYLASPGIPVNVNGATYIYLAIA